jgi:serine/threonine-protein kinase HipA
VTRIRVHLEADDGPVPVGTAEVDRLRGVTTTRFSYDEAYLAGPGWSLGPDLPVTSRGELLTEGLPGALDDSAPDTWGCNLITRRLASVARNAGHVAPTPTEVDFLLGVNDVTRQGALRYSLDGARFLAVGNEVPRLIDLAELLEATRRVVDDRDAQRAVDRLLDAGSGSLGGARPKASVTDGDRLHIAKFPHPGDRWDVMRWEAVALDLAAACGLTTPGHRLLAIGGDPVLLVERFDRRGGERVPFLSARSLIGARADTTGDYLELAEAITDHGSDVRLDLAQLWRRIAFSIAINNTDDHLRNHGFLRAGSGWTLSPVYDVNPDPDAAAQRVTSIAGATTSEASVDALFASAANFDLAEHEASSVWREVLEVVAGWRQVAERHGLDGPAMERFAPAFERWPGR